MPEPILPALLSLASHELRGPTGVLRGYLRLLDQDAGPAAPVALASWPCTDGRGATSFDIVPGRYALDIEVICEAQEGEPDVNVPEPIVRDISEGGLASLRALLIVANGSDGRACVVP